ncbi:MAG: GNAT family N-acetyltransferase [Rhodoplanes sp.]|uniref:GNAT family N-acetyltransferase n=1 Tax=Rhodoplanes sp. TaxID=1968906 RepID=UPI0017D1DCF5|nr:GNAT family N-acetyltransferase [Rhodoplanes sp.]NVO15330.1 GNAT family N-acetyltransferase [Rhodoplanes sp.]
MSGFLSSYSQIGRGRANEDVVVDASPEFDFLSAEYRELFDRAAATAFQSPIWLECLFRRLVPGAAVRPLIVTVRERCSRRLVAVLPLVVRHRFGLRIAEFADLGVSDYCAVIVDPEFAGLLSTPAVTAEVRVALRSSDLVVVNKVPQAALATFGLLGDIRVSAMPLHAHFLDPRGSLAAWRARTHGHCRGSTLDGKRRKLAAQGRLETRMLSDSDQIAAAIDAVGAFRRDRFRARGIVDLLSDPSYAAFYREIVGTTPPARGYVMRLDDRTIAAGFGIVVGGVFHLLLSGFDTSFRSESVGLLMIEDIVLDCLRRGERGIDLTIGDQAYKTQFGSVASDLWTVCLGIGPIGRIVALALARWGWARRTARFLARYRPQ